MKIRYLSTPQYKRSVLIDNSFEAFFITESISYDSMFSKLKANILNTRFAILNSNIAKLMHPSC